MIICMRKGSRRLPSPSTLRVPATTPTTATTLTRLCSQIIRQNPPRVISSFRQTTTPRQLRARQSDPRPRGQPARVEREGGLDGDRHPATRERERVSRERGHLFCREGRRTSCVGPSLSLSSINSFIETTGWDAHGTHTGQDAHRTAPLSGLTGHLLPRSLL